MDNINIIPFKKDARVMNSDNPVSIREKEIDKINILEASILGMNRCIDEIVKNKKAIVYGSLAGFIFQTPIEIFDGSTDTPGSVVSDHLSTIAVTDKL